MAQSATWVVTGANRGLGLEFVQDLLRSSSNIVIATARNPSQASSLQDLRSRSPQRLYVLQLDVTDESQIQQFVKDVTRILGDRGLDYLLNNAGVGKPDTPLNLTAQDFLTIFKTNVLGPALVYQALVPLLEKGDRKVVVNISSRLGSISATPEQFQQLFTTYSSCKAALNMLSVKAACEKPDFIILPLSPGHNKTDMGGDAAPLDPKETIPILLKWIVSTTSAHSGKNWDYWGVEVGIKEQPW